MYDALAKHAAIQSTHFRSNTLYIKLFPHDIRVSGIDGVVQTPPFLHFNGFPFQQATRSELVFKSAATASHIFFFLLDLALLVLSQTINH